MVKLRPIRRKVLLLVLLAISAGFGFQARSGGIQDGGIASQPPTTGRAGGVPGSVPGSVSGSDENNPEIEQMRHRQAEARNVDRQKQIVKDTERLYALAAELKDEVAKTNKDTLSIEVIKKADEIEKLAKSVREKMKSD